MSYRISSVSRSDCGYVKLKNEDSFVLDRNICQHPATTTSQVLSVQSTHVLQWYAVFDGISGGSFGEEASYVAAKALLEYGNRLRWRFPNGIQHLLKRINTAVCEAIIGRRGGCTAAIAFIKGKQLLTVHAGDSRVYLFRDKCLTRLTKDHRMSQLFNENPHAVFRYLGMQAACNEIYTISEAIELRRGDRILICSDGLTDMVKDSLIFRRLECTESLETIAGLLTEDALHSGGIDNITVVIAEVE